MGKIIKDTLHANGIDIGIYTQDFENEFISLTDMARYKFLYSNSNSKIIDCFRLPLNVYSLS